METIYVDTHIIVWLYYGVIERLSEIAKKYINEYDLLISPIVLLEIQYLFETKKISDIPEIIYQTLNNDLGVKTCRSSFESISKNAFKLSFTKDPFDRIIVAHADFNNRKLLTKDKLIRDNYHLAVW